MLLETALNRAKANLIKKAKEYGICENFGQNEVRKIKAEFNYNDLIYGSEADRRQAKQIAEFDDWCMITQIIKKATKFNTVI